MSIFLSKYRDAVLTEQYEKIKIMDAKICEIKAKRAFLKKS